MIEMLEHRQMLAVGIFSADQDVGSAGLAGSAVYTNGTYNVSGSGADIGGNADQFHFTYDSFGGGDGSIVAKLNSLSNTDASAKAGVMFRNDLDPDAAFAGLFFTPANAIAFVTRSADGGTAGSSTTFGPHIPQFIRLTRGGSLVTASYSGDGVTWTQVGSPQTITFGSGVLAGLAVTSHNSAAVASANFTNVSAVLPGGWGDNDVGAPSLSGSASYSSANNRYTVNASGSDIGGTSDQFNFVGRTMTGDGSVIARIDQLSSADPGAKAGVMVRNDASAAAMFASASLTPQNSILFQWRTTTGAAAGSVTISPGLSGPIWLNVSEHGNQFSAYYSGDQIHWTQVGATQTIVMSSATTLAGLAVTSHNNSTLAMATFSGTSVVQGGWSDYDLGSPALTGSASYDPPSNTYTLLGNGADIYGTSDQFNFASRSMSGDGSVIAYVNSITNTDPWAKAGVMIRSATPSADAAFAGLFVSPTNGIVFEWRPTAGAAVQQEVSAPPGGPVGAPVSLRLTRTANSFSAYYSTDGINWILVGPAQSVPLTVSTAAGIAVTSHNIAALCTATFTGVSVGANPPPGAGVFSAADELFLDDLENREVLFFYNETNPNTGLVPDGALASGGSNGSASSIASLGFGLTALTIADQRGWLTHAAAYQRALTTVNFLFNNAEQKNGFYYHFLNTTTGARSGNSELSSVDTAELMAGVVNVAQYWAGTTAQTVATNIFNRVNWPFMQRPNGQFYGAWTPESGFSGAYSDFSEAVVLYLLGLGSPTHPIARSSWNSWSRTPVVSYAGMTYVTASDAALFTVQYPQAWFDLRGLSDSTGLNYYQNAKTATLAQRQWMTDISTTWPDYGPNMWGLTPSDSAHGYAVWGGPPAFGPIDGTVVPTGPGGSLAFTPRQSVDALKHMASTYGSNVYRKYGLVDAFNPLTNWTSSIVLGIDVGMTLIAAENARSSFVWNVFNQSPVARQSLASAFASITPTLVGAVSRKTNASSVVSDIPLDLAGGVTIENRQGGPTQLVLTFGANIVAGPGFAVSLSKAGGGSDGNVVSTSINGSTLTINLSGTLDAQTLVVNITDLRHNSTSASGNYTLKIGVLSGDANRDGIVDVTDLGILATNWQVSGTSVGGDFNFDGLVDVTDLGILATNWQLSVPLSAPAVAAPTTLSSVKSTVRRTHQRVIESIGL
jgi:hypothetical protein